ncbi:hypothetical protein TSOC_012713 [Tetrabaena socialis]|uniref:Uncharacterized protein n=1 Tax=Tetrabaena socialis TaxID=47790 RepID=A0A2J7ZMB8_9CHLO|nr:hypothetical protein TSOC_012713 [Tetrabaena socialis]|eukprot:PNH01411.1 hypothetical protein TSOC_012713 [Tetrabaena socialis]
MSLAYERRAITVVLASPNRDHYKEFLKLPGATKLYMSYWTEDEVMKCRERVHPDLSEMRVKELLLLWGGIPRYILEKVRVWCMLPSACTGIISNRTLPATQANDVTAQQSLDDALSTCNWEDLKHCVGEPDSAQPANHKLVHLEVEANDFSRKTMKLASRYVADQLAIRGGQEHKRVLKEMVQSCLGSPAFAAAAGQMFKAFAHRVLQEGGIFEVRQLLPGTSNSSQIHYVVSRVEQFGKLTEVKPEQQVYWLPDHPNFPAVDALMQPESLFQMSLSQKKEVNMNGLRAAGAQLTGPTKRLYFVVPAHVFEKYMPVHNVSGIEQWALKIVDV